MSVVNLGTARILIIVALVAVGAVVLANGFDEGSGSSGASPSASVTSSGPGVSPSASTSVSPSEAPSPTPPPATSDVIIAVLNGTNVTGLASEAQVMLLDEGYKAATDPANAPQTGVEVTTVYYRPGENAAQNKSDATYISETFFPGSKVSKLGSTFNDIVANSATVVIVVGQDYAESVAA
jgi:hypothetical protein